jgi:hypothetical protein
MMNLHNSAVGLFESHLHAEAGIRVVAHCGVDMTQISLVGADHQSGNQVVEFFPAGNGTTPSDPQDETWSGAWGLLIGAGFYWVPGVGPLLAAGPLVPMLIGANDGQTIDRSHSALRVSLLNMGIPRNRVAMYESAIHAGKFILAFHGTPREVERAEGIFSDAESSETAMYGREVGVVVSGERLRVKMESVVDRQVEIPALPEGATFSPGASD